MYGTSIFRTWRRPTLRLSRARPLCAGARPSFQPHKLLIDPYSKRLGGQFTWSDLHFGYRRRHKQADLSFDRRDNSRVMHKSVVVDTAHT